MSVVLTDAEKARRDKLAGMLGSAHDGEICNAARFLQKMAAEKKVTLVELLTSSPSSTSNGSSYDYSDYRDRQRERARREREEWERPSYGLPRDWQDRLLWARQVHRVKSFMSPWELEFVGDILARGETRPTEKQAAIIQRILVKLDLAEKRERARANARHEPWEDE